MTASGLKALYERNNCEGHFFDHDTMRFFGDTMRNFGVRDAGRITALVDGDIREVEAWDLYRRRPAKGGRYGHCAYFRKTDGMEIFNYKE